jgi:isopenicillin N synthase-like dioxygenase
MPPAPTPAALVIDIAPFLYGSAGDKRQVAAEVGAACEQIGFLAVAGHGVDEALVLQAGSAARAFFDLPADDKNKLGHMAGGAGYSPLKGESLAATLGQSAPADLKESLNVSADFANTPWPARPAGLRQALTTYFLEMDRLAGDLLRICAVALGLPEDFFASKIDHSSSFLRIINYPPPIEAPQPGQLRAGAHTDYGTLTILRSENVAGGLQVRARGGDWLDVPAPERAFIVNLGDMLMRWTNDRWISTLHRVVNPPASAGPRSRRQSLVFFHNPNPDAIVECLPGCCDAANPARYPPIAAGEFIAEKSRKAYDAKN